MKIKLSPSIMCANMCRLEEEIQVIEKLGMDFIHFDIMDGNFVPNLTFGFDFVKQVKAITKIPLDVHLMTYNPDFYIERFNELGCESITVHSEATIHLDRSINLIKDAGARVGVALNPSTSLYTLEYILDQIDFVLVMTVNPGFSGQHIVEGSFRKIFKLSEMIKNQHLSVDIQVDGNVSFENIPKLLECGANFLVLGTSSLYYKKKSIKENFKQIKKIITSFHNKNNSNI